MSLEEIKEKISILRNDTNAYGYDNDNINLADILEAIVEGIEGRDESGDESGDERSEMGDASGEAFE